MATKDSGKDKEHPLSAPGNEAKDLTVQQSGLPALPDPATLKEIFEANFEGLKPRFEVIKMPTAGATIWSIPGEGEEPDLQKEIVGIVLDHYATRVYWDTEMTDGGGKPPTCFSLNGKEGSLARVEKNWYGDCASCAFSQWGTATKNGKPSRGQACQKRHRIFVLIEGQSILPYLISLPPSSGDKMYDGSFSTYVVKLAGKLKSVGEVRSKIKLIKDRNEDNIEYAKAQFFSAGDLTAEEKTKVKALREMLKPAMREKIFEPEEGNPATGPQSSGPEPWEEG